MNPFPDGGDCLRGAGTFHVSARFPPYLPTTNVAKRDVRRLYSQVVAMDQRVGGILAELEAAGELEKTIVFWYTDHG
ncbi:MAG: sulfatase-like hydrolase/transferase, partial [Phaeodactylibacter sp.]|nr:sulfatase-like hydrolase/transferase [Phaeodactylibacter sp.]